MALLDKVLGNAEEINPESVKEELGYIFIEGETIQHAYRVIRDLMIFTNHRLVIVDKQGVTGSKLGIQSIPYKNIISFTINTAGTLDLDSELYIYVKEMLPILKAFKSDDLIFEVQAVLMEHVILEK